MKITNVALVDAHNLRLQEVYLLPIRHATLIGNQASWPPITSDAKHVWDQRVPVTGTMLQAGKDDVRNLVLHLKADPAGLASSTSAPLAGFDSVALTYEANGKTYLRRTTVTFVTFVIQPRCDG